MIYKNGFPILQDAATETGTGNDLNIEGLESLTIIKSGDAAGLTLSFQVSIDGTNFAPYAGMNAGTDARASSTSGTTNEAWVFEFQDSVYNWFRAEITGISSGSCTVTSQ
jgi:hypothetical protein